MATKLTRGSLIWLPATGGESVDDAIVVGNTDDGAELHIARAPIEDTELAPGKLVIGFETAFIPFHTEEKQCAEYEVLANPGCANIVWVAAADGEVPVGAVEGGTCGQEEPIYVVRCTHEENVVPGKLVPRTNNAYIPLNGEELTKNEYEVLCVATVQPLKPVTPDEC